MKLQLDVTKSIDQNASIYYDRSKKSKKKLEGAKESLEKSIKELAKLKKTHQVEQEKIVVKVTSLKQLEQIKKDAFFLNLPCSEVTDAGHTQIDPGTTTCLSIGPAPEETVDKVTGDLKLL